jgi:hypothetical protein
VPSLSVQEDSSPWPFSAYRSADCNVLAVSSDGSLLLFVGCFRLCKILVVPHKLVLTPAASILSFGVSPGAGMKSTTGSSGEVGPNGYVFVFCKSLRTAFRRWAMYARYWSNTALDFKVRSSPKIHNAVKACCLLRTCPWCPSSHHEVLSIVSERAMLATLLLRRSESILCFTAILFSTTLALLGPSNQGIAASVSASS